MATRQVLPLIDLRGQAERQDPTGSQRSAQMIKTILQTLGEAEKVRRERQTLDRITRAIAAGATDIEAIAAAAKQQPPQFGTGFQGILQKLGGAFQPQGGGIEQSIQKMIIGEKLKQALAPKAKPTPFTLGPGLTRFTGKGEKVAEVPPKRQLIDIYTPQGTLTKLPFPIDETFQKHLTELTDKGWRLPDDKTLTTIFGDDNKIHRVLVNRSTGEKTDLGIATEEEFEKLTYKDKEGNMRIFVGAQEELPEAVDEIINAGGTIDTSKSTLTDERLKLYHKAKAAGNEDMAREMLLGRSAVEIKFGKPAAAAERTAIAKTRASIDALNNLKELFDSTQTETGPIVGRIAPTKGLFGLTTDEQEAFMAATSAFKNAIIKEITGAQMSEVEAKRIMKQVPDITDPPTRWLAKWEQSKKNLEFLQKRRLEILQQSGLRAPIGEDFTITTESQDISQISDEELKRIAEIE